MKGGVFVENEFIDFMKNKRLSENTYNSYANDIKIFKIYYEDSYGEPLVKLVHADIAMYSNYLKKNNIKVISLKNKEYPKQLKNIDNKPVFLYVRGKLDNLYSDNIAIVGSRNASEYGKYVSRKIAKEISDKNINIVSRTSYRN